MLRTGPEKRLSHTNPKCSCSDTRLGAAKRAWSKEAKERERKPGEDECKAGR